MDGAAGEGSEEWSDDASYVRGDEADGGEGGDGGVGLPDGVVLGWFNFRQSAR